jgi:hypothetical protein
MCPSCLFRNKQVRIRIIILSQFPLRLTKGTNAVLLWCHSVYSRFHYQVGSKLPLKSSENRIKLALLLLTAEYKVFRLEMLIEIKLSLW